MNQSDLESHMHTKSAPSVGKHVTCTKRGKTCHLHQVGESKKPAPSAGKYNRQNARENMKLATSAEKHAPRAGKNNKLAAKAGKYMDGKKTLLGMFLGSF